MTPISSAVNARVRLDQDIALTLSAAQWEWQHMTPYLDDSWSRIGPRVTSLVESGQFRTAERAPLEVAQMLDEQRLPTSTEGTFKPASLVGVASDGRALESLLYQAVVAAGNALNAGAGPAQALAYGWTEMEKLISTQIADANRVAGSVQSVLSPAATVSVRVVNPGACSRCIALAGRTSGAVEAFLRHPKCRCKNIPTNGEFAAGVGTDPMDYFRSLSEEEQDRAFTKAGAQAIRDGADMFQVVNARRGMTTTATGRLKRNRFGTYTTTEGMTRRGWANSVMKQNPNWVRGIQGRKVVKNLRLMPESIYEIAKDRDDAIRLLKTFGYF